MQNNFTRSIAMKKYGFLICLALILATMLSACGGEAAETTLSESTTEATTVATEPVVTSVDVVRDGKPVFNVVRDEDADTAALVVAQARSIIDKIRGLTGAMPKLNTDWVKRGSDLDSTTYEILLGVTDYPETKQVMESLKYGECAIRLVGNKIVVFGYTDTTMAHAVTHLNRVLESAVSEDKKNITVTAQDLEYFKVQDEQMSALPMYEGGTFRAYYKPGNSSNEFIIGETTVEEYREYLKKLDNSGFTCYTTHEITGNHFATYNSDKYTVTAGFYDYEDSVRLIIEPLAPAVGLKEDNVYTPVTTSQITMLGMEYKNNDGSFTSNGLSVLIRLTDGRFIIVDGGFNRAKHSTELMRHLKEQSAGYAKSMKDITIAAWIVTHPHGDHDGLLYGKYSDFMGIKVERVLANFLSDTELSKADNSSTVGGNWGTGEGFEYQKVLQAAKAFGATVHQVHVGQVFYFADLKMEVLYTIESFGPKVCNALNTTSIVLRMEFGGETVYLSTGDATGNGMEICTKMYGDYLHSDIVQVCHHGYGTWGNDGGMIKAYQTINAPTVLWPQGMAHYPTHKTYAYNSVLFDVPNYKEVYVSGAEGDSIILPIPYTVGTGIVHRAAG
jgi:beta-lactamase superfamily II metal-dependent hydrolase